MDKTYYRPIVQSDQANSDGFPLAGGARWFSHVEMLTTDGEPSLIPASDLPKDVRERLTSKRNPLCGLDLNRPQIMGILNVTPDSFSDGGQHNDLKQAVARAEAMVDEGADILDIGGESTRPGADFVSNAEEIARTAPVIKALGHLTAPISIDTRKSDVAQAAAKAGALIFNDVSALSFDPDSLATAAKLNIPVCLMHASGDPKTMQANPSYDHVLLDVYDYLEARRDAALDAGIALNNIILDPGIGFGKTLEHNLTLLKGLSLFHGLGCPILLGASRKRFIGTLTGSEVASDRMPGSVAVALEAVRQGVQILRVHDVAETKQALTVWGHLHA